MDHHSIDLSPAHRALVDELVGTGAFDTPADVVSAALDVIAEDEGFVAAHRALKARLAAARAALDAGEGTAVSAGTLDGYLAGLSARADRDA